MKSKNWLCSKIWYLLWKMKIRHATTAHFSRHDHLYWSVCERERERERENHRKSENFHACIGEIPDFACVVGKLARRTVHLLQFSKVTVWPLHYIVRATVCECNIFKTCASCAGVACSEEWLGSLLQPTEEIYTSWLCLLEKNFSYRLLIPFFFISCVVTST